MRSSLLLRLAVIFGLVATIGLPGFGAPDLVAAESRTAPTSLLPADEVWSGTLAASTDAPPARDDAPSGAVEPLIVRFRAGASRAAQVSAHHEAGARRSNALALSGSVRVEVASTQRDSALAAYNARPDVLYAEPDYPVHALYTPNDPQYASQWGPKKIGAEAAWNVTRGASSVRVAVVDCGVFSEATGRLASDGLPGHPDLRGQVLANQDFTGSSTGFDDFCDHGTHVAGIIGAAGNNGVGISGLAPEMTLLNAKVLGDGGSGSTSNIVNGVIWAVQHGAHVVNLSLGRNGACSQSERDTMAYAWSQGVVVVAAAGNSSLGSSGAPANCENVISVASTTSSDVRSSFSNYGANVDVAAPGSSILSTVRSGDYAQFSGTSMAAPHVAGLAGLIRSLNPGATAQSVLDRIRTTSDPIGGTGTLWAWGRVNAAAALAGGPPPGATPTATPATPTASPTSSATPTRTPTATPTRTPTPTTTQVAVPTRAVCPSPRPPIQRTTTATSATTLDVLIQAGAGVVREVSFRDLRNAAITVGDRSGIGTPFVYRPTTFSSDLSFTVARPSPGQPTTVSLVIVDDCGPWATFVGVGPGGGARGSVSGTVRSAGTSEPIANATVRVRGTNRTDRTDASGRYAIDDLSAGNVTLDVSAGGYASQSAPATVQQRLETVVDVSLTPTSTLPDVSIALTWGARPADLDIHLSGPTTSGQRFHLYWDNRNAASHAVLSPDDHDGHGPETVTLKKSSATGAWVPGEYRLWVHNYGDSSGFGGSSARVVVTRGGQELGAFEVTNASGSPSLPLWRSVNVIVDAGGNLTVMPVQQMVSGGSSTVLQIQDGAEGAIEWPSGGKR